MNKVLFVFLCIFKIVSISTSFKCAPCSLEDVLSCPVVEESSNCQLVEEPNCGCCLMCARNKGQSCGLALGTCAKGLKCGPSITQNHPKRDLITEEYLGLFVCMTEEEHLKAYESLESTPQSDAENFIYPQLSSPLRGGNLNEIPKVSITNKKKACFDHLNTVWNKPYFARFEWVPECKPDGVYSPLQCETAFGLIRGRCWCVNGSGKPTSGFIPQPFEALCRNQDY